MRLSISLKIFDNKGQSWDSVPCSLASEPVSFPVIVFKIAWHIYSFFSPFIFGLIFFFALFYFSSSVVNI